MLLFFIGESKAQSNQASITGIVSTEKNLPIELANIALLSIQDSTFIQGTCSGPDGSFEITSLLPKKHLLQISYLGYQTRYISCNTGNIGQLVLQTETTMLDETVITAQRPIYKLKGNMLVTTVPHTLLSSVGTAKEVLKHIPGIRLSEDGFSVFGKGAPLIYINNHLIQSDSELEKLSSDKIEKVELITTPGAEYDATVEAVIRIRTINHKRNGMNIDAKLNLTQAKRTNHYEQLNLNYQKQKLSLFSTLYYSQQQIKRSQNVQYNLSANSDFQINSQSHLLSKANMTYAKLGMGYDMSPRHILGAAYEINSIPNAKLDMASVHTENSHDILTDVTNYTSQSNQNGITHQVNAYYQGTVQQLKIDFMTDFVNRRDYNHQEANEKSQASSPRKITTHNRSGNTFYAAKLVLTYPVGHGECKVGADYTHIRRKDRFTNPQDLLPTTDSRIYEEKIAGFAEYSATFGKVSTSAGLRLEHILSNYWEKDIRIPEQSRMYNDWCPNLSINLPIKKVETSLSYNVKTNRPSFFQLRSSLNYNNRFIYEGGNPLLTPETIHAVSLMGLYKWLQVSLSYQYRKNAIGFATKSHESTPDIIIFTVDNFPKMQVINSYVSLSPHFQWWKPEFGVYFTKPFFRVENMGKLKTMNQPQAYVSWNNSFELPAGIILSLDADYQTQGNSGAMTLQPNGGVDAGFRKSFFKDTWNINIQATDLFASRRNSFMLHGSKLTYSKRSYADTRRVFLTIRYRFNASEARYKGKHVSDKDMQRL